MVFASWCAEGPRVRCFTRGGFDCSDRFTAIVEAARRIEAQSFLIDGKRSFADRTG
jgi:ATP-dependent DNA ligase